LSKISKQIGVKKGGCGGVISGSVGQEYYQCAFLPRESYLKKLEQLFGISPRIELVEKKDFG